jgi:hypothetical protein
MRNEDGDVRREGHVMSESDWNETSSVSDHPYGYAKTQAEKLVWQLAKEQAGPQVQ